MPRYLSEVDHEKKVKEKRISCLDGVGAMLRIKSCGMKVLWCAFSNAAAAKCQAEVKSFGLRAVAVRPLA